MEAEVDYVRIYQPIKPLTQAEEAIWGCASAGNEVMLDLLEGVHFLQEGGLMTDGSWFSLMT